MPFSKREQGRRTGVDESGLAREQGIREARVFEQAAGGESGLVAFGLGGSGAVEAEGFVAGGIHEEDALEAPLDAGELADEVVLDVVAGEEVAGRAVDKALEGGVVSMADNEKGAGLDLWVFGSAAAGAFSAAHEKGRPLAGL